MMFVVAGITLLCFVMIYDLNVLRRLFNWRTTTKIQLGILDAEVRDQMRAVDAMTRSEISTKVLVVKHLMKKYGNKIAVKDSTFILQP